MTSVAAINNLGGYAHNPRGNLWFKDDSTYGHKLLTKMGWNKGKGLGKNEDGIKENLKVKFRNTNSGLGFKDDAHTNVMKTEYESILKSLTAVYSCSGATNLSKNDDNSEEKASLKTKVVKSKLRYPKLFFGKDVTKYSEKDMKSIFVCSIPLKSLEEKPENPVNDKKDLQSESSQTLPTYSSSLSISDYFAKKMEEKKRNTATKQICNSNIDHQACLETENAVSQEFSDIEKPNEILTETMCLGSESSVLSDKNPSRKKKKKSEMNAKDVEINSKEVNSCVSNVAEEEILDSTLGKNNHNNNLCTVEKFSKPNKKRKLSEAFKCDSNESSEITYSNDTKSLSSPKKKKKKNKNKKYSVSGESPSENSSRSIEINENTNKKFFLEPNVDGLSKKKKKSKKKLKEKLKSCLKKKCDSYSFKNVSFNEIVSYKIIDSDIESVDPLAFNENLDENTVSCKLTDIVQNNSDDNTFSEEELTSCEQHSSNDVCVKDQDQVSKELDKEFTLSDLPSSKSSHFNAWVESQRQAMKMELYKKMLKSIKKHKILKTTNLLSIKGYGNWGF